MLSPPINLYASFQRVPPAPAMRREKAEGHGGGGRFLGQRAHAYRSGAAVALARALA